MPTPSWREHGVNHGPDAAETFVSEGNNLIGETNGSSGWVGSDLTGTVAQPLDPLLAPLAYYGGPTDTMALLPGSPAISAGNIALVPSRYYHRSARFTALDSPPGHRRLPNPSPLWWSTPRVTASAAPRAT